MKKHDKYLYIFYGLQRNAIRYLVNKHTELPKSDYKILRELINSLDLIIRQYEQDKAPFNIRKLKKHISCLKKASDIQVLPNTENDDIRKLATRISIGVIDAFIAYAPLFKYEFILKACLFILKATAIMGLKRAGIFLEEMKEVKNIIARREALLCSNR
ncbi:hypothetical conserved protein [Candidatus Nitrosoglobus terrae]|uniref:Hypothetical conserved protein n=1 Tax=Candidatus Nitrosoglobus terrae TaxID=1630141 RepID=A0A1Q2SKV1_9GAMM|nr:hypothetical protein [Candidatus Nitrosoglobus terrae]BAW79739.1 hypothetical conserved protein [Candidatus Nitrosoglobus terrae]